MVGTLKRSLILVLSLGSTGCVALLGGTYQTADVVSTGATAVSYGATGKGITDHIVSEITGKDCRALNILKHKDVCEVEYDYRSGLRAVYVNDEQVTDRTDGSTAGGWSPNGTSHAIVQNNPNRGRLHKTVRKNHVIKRSSKKVHRRHP